MEGYIAQPCEFLGVSYPLHNAGRNYTRIYGYSQAKDQITPWIK